MAQMLGQTILGKKVVSQTGVEIGRVFDLDFEVDGTVTFLIVKPDPKNTDMGAYVNSNNLLEIPYSEVKAVGEYVVVDFPKSW